jgi:glyoxylase-like metal-dependent hydrolase (beta-lactamase superfamily II)
MVHILDLNFQQLPHTIAAFLLLTDQGPALIETGPHSTFPELRRQLAFHGLEPADIRHVFLSHIHLDHAGAAWALAETGATIYVHPFGARHLMQPERLLNSARRIYQDQMDVLWGDMKAIPAEQIRTTGHEESIDLGNVRLCSWHTPGHAVHHIVWQLGDAAFTGDVAGVQIGNGIIAPPCPPPDIHVEDWQQSLGLIRRLQLSKLYLTHFGAITNVSAHLDQLEERLLSWADWMLPYFEKGAGAQEITPLFQEFVQQQLREAGADEMVIRQYEAANPSWMSVEGLLRYWAKKKAETQ